MGLFLEHLLFMTRGPKVGWGSDTTKFSTRYPKSRATTHWQEFKSDTSLSSYYEVAQNGSVIPKYQSISHISTPTHHQILRDWGRKRELKFESRKQYISSSFSPSHFTVGTWNSWRAWRCFWGFMRRRMKSRGGDRSYGGRQVLGSEQTSRCPSC